jgi:hypothetical protein
MTSAAVPSDRRFAIDLRLACGGARANPAKVEDFCDQDLLQHIDLARFLFGKPISACREAR